MDGLDCLQLEQHTQSHDGQEVGRDQLKHDGVPRQVEEGLALTNAVVTVKVDNADDGLRDYDNE